MLKYVARVSYFFRVARFVPLIFVLRQRDVRPPSDLSATSSKRTRHTFFFFSGGVECAVSCYGCLD